MEQVLTAALMLLSSQVQQWQVQKQVRVCLTAVSHGWQRVGLTRGLTDSNGNKGVRVQ
jgi:hypothetical protein